MSENKLPENSKALTLRDQYIGAAMTRINALQSKGELDIPQNYSVGNALNAAWLILQQTVDKDKRPALDVCTKESVGYSLLDMTIQGLNPAKKQGYFIVYGNKLQFQRSYFGTVAVLKRVDLRVDEVVSEVVYEKDVFKYKLDGGKKIIIKHEQELENIDDNKIKAAYCIVYDRDKKTLASQVMTMAELMQAWKQSRQSPIDENGKLKIGSVHNKFTGEMAKKTVLGRTCKMLIDASDDSTILSKHAKRSADETYEEVVESEIEELANQGDVIDIELEPVQTAEIAKLTNGTAQETKQEQTAVPGF